MSLMLDRAVSSLNPAPMEEIATADNQHKEKDEED